jgi:hypothetical protein
MINRFSNSWALVQASLAVLRADTELLIFPVISAIGVVLVSAGFLVPFVVAGHSHRLEEGPLPFLLGFLFYFATYFVIFFCNSALVGAAMIRLRGGDPTVMDGLRIAFSHFGAIVGYALLSATVGMILKSLQERAGLLGRILISIVGFAWNVATFLAVPVLVVEGVGPIAAVKRSSALLKKTWGEQVIGNGGVGLVFGTMIFGLVLIGIPIFMAAAAAHSPALLIAVGAVLALAFIALLVLNATLSSIYTAALYLYAAEGTAGGQFQPQLIQGAFRPKK